jgi:hypothetical protein
MASKLSSYTKALYYDLMNKALWKNNDVKPV